MVSPSELLPSPAGRLEFIHAVTHVPVVDDDGNETGEVVSLISPELAQRLIDAS